MSRPDIIVEYSDYIRNYLKENEPKDWNVGLWGKFPASSNMLQKYFKHILEQGVGSRDKVKAIENHYKLNKKDSVDKKMFEIEGRTRSISNFLENKTVPFEKNLNFIAFIFDVPICTLNAFIENNKIQKVVVENTLEEDKIPLQDFTNTGLKPNIETHIKAKSVKKSVFLSLSVIAALFVIAIGFYSLIGQNDENINKVAKSSFLPVDIGNKLFEIKAITNNNQQDTGLNFHTFNIFNDKCLYKNTPWSFTIDHKGEDMSSSYGSPFNKTIQSLHPILNGRTTIANQMMEIHFNIANNTDKNLFFANLEVKVVKTFDAKAEQAEYNLYQSRNFEEVFDITLSDKNLYGFTVSKQKVKPHEAIFCKCIITGDDKCNDLIYKIQIIADFVDVQGKHYTVVSDKNYLIGFVDSE